MHIPDRLLDDPTTITTCVLALAGVAASIRWLRTYKEAPSAAESTDPHEIPSAIADRDGAASELMLPVAAAFVFAAQMLNYPVAVGVSAHFMGAALAAMLLGPLSAGLVLTLVLIPQALLHGDGGVTALGANILNMGVIGGVGAGLMIKLFAKLMAPTRRNMLIAAAAASWLSVMLATLAVCIEVGASGQMGFGELLVALGGFNAVAGIGEAVVTVAALGLIARERPDLIRGWPQIESGEGNQSAGGSLTGASA